MKVMNHLSCVALFPGPVHSSLAVRNSHRGPGLVHHVMSATAYVMAFHRESMTSQDRLARRFTLKEAPKDHSGGLYASLANCYKSQ